MWKKTISIGLVLLAVLGGGLTAAADSTSAAAIGIIRGTDGPAGVAIVEKAAEEKDVKVPKEEAKKMALGQLKKFFGIDVDEKKYKESIQLNPYYVDENTYAWQLNWSLSNDTGYTFINVEIDSSTGRLLGFNKNESIRDKGQITVASISMEQARKMADESLKKICPDEYGQTKLNEDYSRAINLGMTRPDYSFNYIREVNGIRYPDNCLTVRINGADGSITSYQARWDYNAVFPSAENLINGGKALSLYKSRIEMDLNYIPVRNKALRYAAITEVKLSYFPDMGNGFLLDAKSGEFINYSGERIEEPKTLDVTKERKDSLASSKPQLPNASSEMDSEAAEAAMNSLAKEFFGVGYRVVNLSYSESGALSPEENRKTWNAEVMEDRPEAYETKGNISIDSSTGEILSIGRFLSEDWYGKEYERKLSWEQAYDKAVEILAKYFPYRIEDMRTEQIYRENLMQVNGKLLPDRMIYFNFSRLVNGIPYANDSISITVDTKTGEITDLYHRWDKNLSFPNGKSVTDKEKAEEIFFSVHDVKPIYYKCMKRTDDGKCSSDYRIVYKLEPKDSSASRSIDAFTGKFLDSYGAEIKAPKSSFNEVIKGHPAEKVLSILAFQGIIDADSFEPNREITYIELINMLVNAKGYHPYKAREQEELLFKNIDNNSQYYSYLLEAVRYGIIENKPEEIKLDAKVTREQMVELVVKLLKYEKLAKAKDIFMLSFKDYAEISSDLRGHVAIAKGLGIIEGTSEMFRPKENLKMHEAALIMYKTFENMK